MLGIASNAMYLNLFCFLLCLDIIKGDRKTNQQGKTPTSRVNAFDCDPVSWFSNKFVFVQCIL